MKFTRTKMLAAAGLTAASLAAISIAGFGSASAVGPTPGNGPALGSAAEPTDGSASAATDPPCDAPQGKNCLALENFRSIDVSVQVKLQQAPSGQTPASTTVLYCQKVPAQQRVFLTDDAHQLTTGSRYYFGEFTHSTTCEGVEDYGYGGDVINPPSRYYSLVLGQGGN